jgi:sugar phosphate permease
VGYISDSYGWAAMLTLMIALSAVSSLTVFRAMVIQRRVDRMMAGDEDKVPLMA